nr:hypothetical protein [Tanacetum cinerariifolium]
MMNELVRNQCDVTNHQVNVQFLLQLQPEWKRFVILAKQSQELKAISYHKLYDILKQNQNEVNEIRVERLARTANPLVLVAQQQPKIYKPTNNNLRNSSNTIKSNQDNSPKINKGTGYDNQRVVNVVGVRENVGTQVVQKSGIQCYNCKEYGHLSRECQKPERVKDVAYHKENMLLCKQEEAEVQLIAKQADWKDDTDDEFKRLLQIQLTIIDQSLMLSHRIREQDDQDDTDELDQEHDLLASLIEKLKCEIDDSKNRNKILESSNNHFKEANNELSKTNQLMFKDLKKIQAELDKYHDVNYASKMEIDCAKAKGDLMSYKIEYEKSSTEYTRKINDLNQTILGRFNFGRTSLTGFPDQSVGSSNINVLDSPCLLVLNTETSQSRQHGVIPTTSVSRPSLKSNPQGDRVLRSNSHGKKLKVEEHRRNVMLPKNKTSVTTCNDSLNAKSHDLCVPKSVAKPLRKTVGFESVKKPRNNVRKLHERIGKIYKWSYIKFTPSGYMWKPKSTKENVNSNVSMPLANASRTANVKDNMTFRRSIVSNTPLSSNSFAAHKDCSIHRRLW